MKLQPPSTNQTPDGDLQYKQNSLEHPEVRSDIGTSRNIPFAVQFIRQEILLHGHGSRVLDTGTGNGHLLAQLMEELPHESLVGLDLEPAHVKLSRWFTQEKLRIELADFVEHCPIEGRFDFVVAIGWVWKDYRNLHIACQPRTKEPEADMPAKIAAQVGNVLVDGGWFLHDWRTNEQQYDLPEFQRALAQCGVSLAHTIWRPMRFDDLSDQWQENYSVYCYRKGAV